MKRLLNALANYHLVLRKIGKRWWAYFTDNPIFRSRFGHYFYLVPMLIFFVIINLLRSWFKEWLVCFLVLWLQAIFYKIAELEKKDVPIILVIKLFFIYLIFTCFLNNRFFSSWTAGCFLWPHILSLAALELSCKSTIGSG